MTTTTSRAHGVAYSATTDLPTVPQEIPSSAKPLALVCQADKTTVSAAITGALDAKKAWEAVPWPHRAAIFLRAANLISEDYRYQLTAAIMLGQGKNMGQAEKDVIEVLLSSHVRPSRG